LPVLFNLTPGQLRLFREELADLIREEPLFSLGA
jgi:hypothetical protein